MLSGCQYSSCVTVTSTEKNSSHVYCVIFTHFLSLLFSFFSFLFSNKSLVSQHSEGEKIVEIVKHSLLKVLLCFYEYIVFKHFHFAQVCSEVLIVFLVFCRAQQNLQRVWSLAADHRGKFPIKFRLIRLHYFRKLSNVTWYMLMWATFLWTWTSCCFAKHKYSRSQVLSLSPQGATDLFSCDINM